MIFQLIGQGDFVVTYGKRNAEGKTLRCLTFIASLEA